MEAGDVWNTIFGILLCYSILYPDHQTRPGIYTRPAIYNSRQYGIYISPLLFIVEKSKSEAINKKLNTVFTLYFINLVLCILEHKRISIYGNRRLVYNLQSFIERFFWHRPAYSCHRHPLFSNNTWKFVYKYFPCNKS